MALHSLVLGGVWLRDEKPFWLWLCYQEKKPFGWDLSFV